jgi:hypothetical protein
LADGIHTRPHPHAGSAKLGGCSIAANGQFVAKCGKCRTGYHGDFGIMGEGHVAEMLIAAGWTCKDRGKGTRQRWLCRGCSNPKPEQPKQPEEQPAKKNRKRKVAKAAK